ncbi:MAG: hypothetical protein B9S32_16255 [Verrucomicrobia bacterium Tous-C9LFEB]|nr:MAG: hypothetical protein B9S32_16255 [Verrucomicrobia bacterium Tous-C9LFEB]
MKPLTGVPVRIQKAGTPNLACEHGEPSAEPKAIGKPIPTASAAKPEVEPKVEIREIEPGVFEITVTCRCGERAVVRCESLGGESGKKS